MRTIRDSLYDRIVLGPVEEALAASGPFVRLDGIAQLGFVSRVWPGAKHTRYEHSLGVCALMHRALAALAPALDRLPAPWRPDATARATAVAAALLHDVGHYPFSHTLEELTPALPGHEELGRALCAAAPLAGILRAGGLDPARVGALIAPPADAPLAGPDALLRALLSGTFDVDRLDYLPRDSRACNVPYGLVDATRLLESLTVATIDGGPGLAITEKGIGALESFVHARQAMYAIVYTHGTHRAYSAMLARVVHDALDAGALDAPTLLGCDDAGLLAHLDRALLPAGGRALLAAIAARRPHEAAVEIGVDAGEPHETLVARAATPAGRRATERALGAAIGPGLADGGLLLDVPPLPGTGVAAWVAWARPPFGTPPLAPWGAVVGLGAEELARRARRRRLVRLFAPHARVDEVRAGWASALAALA